jgi:DNA-binding transcriptional regulator YiaG
MRIRMTSDRKLFAGTPADIVQQMRELNHQEFPSLDAYIENCRRSFVASGERVEIGGNNEEQRCLSLLTAFVRADLARLEMSSPEHVDRFAVALMRNVLGLSQERLAREIGVAFATINRWETGKTQPTSEAIVDKVNKMAKKVKTRFARGATGRA